MPQVVEHTEHIRRSASALRSIRLELERIAERRRLEADGYQVFVTDRTAGGLQVNGVAVGASSACLENAEIAEREAGA
jgi:hypothetical protein